MIYFFYDKNLQKGSGVVVSTSSVVVTAQRREDTQGKKWNFLL